MKIEGLTSGNIKLESVNASLQNRMYDLVRDTDERAAKYMAEIDRINAELCQKDELINVTIKDYDDLKKIKVAVDAEIAVYRELLESEESRLGISQFGSPEDSGVSSSGGSSIKRRRLLSEEEDVTDHSGQGVLVIEHGDEESFQNSREEQRLSGSYRSRSLRSYPGEDDESYSIM